MNEKERHTRIIRQYFERAWNRGEIELLDELIHPDYINHNPGISNPPPGPEGLKPIIAAMRTGFPDLMFTVNDLVVGDDRIAIRCTMRGTHNGDLFGIPATGHAVEIQQFQIERFEDGKIIEHWRQSDDQGLMKQLGLAS